MTSFGNFALSAATALGLALAPAPAAADSNDIAKVLAGLAVLGIVAKAADNRNDRNVKVDSQSRFSRMGSLNERIDTRILTGDLHRYGDRRQSKSTGYKKSPLPDRCLWVLDSGRGRDRLVYGSRCLSRSFKFAKKLPSQCERLIRTRRGTRTFYGARCLASDGWRVARR